MRRPPPWQMPLTAAITGARLLLIATNGRMSEPSSGGYESPGSERPPRSPPGANTSPTPVMMSADSSGSVFTRCTARLMPKYMAAVNAFLAAGRSITHHAIPRSRSRRSPEVPSSCSIALTICSARDISRERDAIHPPGVPVVVVHGVVHHTPVVPQRERSHAPLEPTGELRPRRVFKQAVEQCAAVVVAQPDDRRRVRRVHIQRLLTRLRMRADHRVLGDERLRRRSPLVTDAVLAGLRHVGERRAVQGAQPNESSFQLR